MKIKIGTRRSKLAVRQAEITKELLLTYKEISEVEIVTIETSGDINQNINWKNSTTSLKGLFTYEIEQQLALSEIDVAVHSLKDIPTKTFDELVISQYIDCEDNRDCLLTLNNKTIDELKSGSVIGTSSKRREVNINKLRSDLEIKPIRGNINTRISKLENNEYDAIVLAYAGVKRLGLTKYVSQVFERDIFIPAPGQGILALQSNISNPITTILRKYQDSDIFYRANLEREFSTIFDGGCQTPVGCYVENNYMHGFYVHKDVYYKASAHYNRVDNSPLAYLLSNKIKSQYKEIIGHVSLVGAGPGDVELLTLKAYNKIKNADIIFVDRLVNSEIVEFKNKDCVVVYVGKTNTSGGTSQEKINQMLVNAAFSFKNIVRLKGGDPFIFGRAYEECEVLEQYKIKYDIVPGISAFSGASSYSNTALTIRNHTTGFSVFSGASNLDFNVLKDLDSTLVFYMSVTNGVKVATGLIEHGFDPNSSAMYIQNATYQDQRTIVFKLKDIFETIDKYKIKAPAILMISKNIDLKLNYDWFNDRRKIKIMSTREDKYFLDFKNQFSEDKYDVVNFAQIKIDLSDVKLDLSNIDVVLFNSVNSVKSVLKNSNIDELRTKTICAVGKKTKAYLEESGVTVNYMSTKATMFSLVTEVMSLYDGLNILITTSNLGYEKLSEQFNHDIYIAYNTSFVNQEMVNELLTTNVICFFSSSAVNSFLKNINYKYELLNNIKIFVLGKPTAQELEKHQLSADVISKYATQEDLISEVKKYYEDI